MRADGQMFRAYSIIAHNSDLNLTFRKILAKKYVKTHFKKYLRNQLIYYPFIVKNNHSIGLFDNHNNSYKPF